MSNIHGFNNLPPRAAAAAPPPQARYQAQPSYGSDGYEGISMMAPQPRADGMQPELSERIFPGIKWRSVVTVVSIIQVVLFIIELIVGGAKYDGAFVKGNDMGGPSAQTLCNMGGKWEPDIRAGAVWRLLTAIVLHAGILHLASNMFFQLRFGFITELRWGRWRWLGLYVLAGVMASLWSTKLGPHSVSVGASGALFGIIGADLTYLAYNWSTIPHNRQEGFFLVFMIVINLLLGMGTGIDNYAHLGGLVGGLFLGIAIPPHVEKRPLEWVFRGAAGFLFAMLALLFILLIWVGNPWPEYPSYVPTDCF